MNGPLQVGQMDLGLAQVETAAAQDQLLPTAARVASLAAAQAARYSELETVALEARATAAREASQAAAEAAREASRAAGVDFATAMTVMRADASYSRSSRAGVPPLRRAGARQPGRKMLIGLPPQRRTILPPVAADRDHALPQAAREASLAADQAAREASLEAIALAKEENLAAAAAQDQVLPRAAREANQHLPTRLTSSSSPQRGASSS